MIIWVNETRNNVIEKKSQEEEKNSYHNNNTYIWNVYIIYPKSSRGKYNDPCRN